MGKKELQFIIKYENNKRNKAILALLWDLNARNEITLLRIKNIRLEKYVKANFLMRQRLEMDLSC
jgi:hypothetical protein